ncbi:biotin--[acetyl-CoA-carboxylase] ligase [Rubritalea tangerina]|uniref:Biotin--[acetyl-CoA-carboxylase] ligase n=2 Tax=Rubritalea tangerina TaxID=430798 RepID=A0ABW4ZAH3_9BACT
MLNSAELIRRLPLLDGKLHLYEQLNSSNDRAAELVREGEGSGTLVVAEQQTKGRGRGGKSWTCPAGEGLLFSFVLEPDYEKVYWPRLALAAGLAVAEAAERYGVEAEIKWPNDVWVGGKKLAGILVEGCEDCAVVGIGLNVSVGKFPEEVQATSLALEGVGRIEREALLVDILQRLIGWGSRCGSGFEQLVEACNKRCALRNEWVQLYEGGEKRVGVLRGISSEGYLVLEAEGESRLVAQADSVRPLLGELGN